ncbi:MAG: hypothetical protein ACR2GH_00630 [Pseudonocardia sp.]
MRTDRPGTGEIACSVCEAGPLLGGDLALDQDRAAGDRWLSEQGRRVGPGVGGRCAPNCAPLLSSPEARPLDDASLDATDTGGVWTLW